jgi:hypothetical protein
MREKIVFEKLFFYSLILDSRKFLIYTVDIPLEQSSRMILAR